MSSNFDPDSRALLYVQQYLSERGYSQALAALERESGFLYDETKDPIGDKGSCLLQLVWGELDRELAQAPADDSELREEEDLMRGGSQDWPQAQQHCIEGLHPSSITCVRLLPEHSAVITGSGDGFVRMLTFEGITEWEQKVGGGGVLSVDVHHGTRRVVAGSMNGSVTVLDQASGSIVAGSTPHAKYVVRVRWAAEGGRVLTASWDNSVAVLEVQGGELCVVQQVPFASTVMDVALLADGTTAVVAVKGTNFLRMLDISSPQVKELPAVNMNEGKDLHVSFHATHLNLSPCGRYLLVSTDGSMMLVLRTKDWAHLRRLHGLVTEQFHQPATAWHRDSYYLYAAAAHGQVFVYHLGTGKVVHKICGHKINVRGIDYYGSGKSNMLATCSFDKTVKVYTS